MSGIYRATSHRRPGAILIAVMIGLGVASALVLTMVQSAAVERRLLLQHCRHHQAAWLCAAGAQRARQAIRSTPDYQGEVWRVPAAELNRPGDGLVTISTTTDPQGTTVVTVVARFPQTAVHVAQITRSFALPDR